MDEEKQKESADRLQQFMEGYKKLVDELQVDFAQYPMFVPDGEGGFKIIVQNTPVDLKNRPQPSPFMEHA